MDVFNDGFQEIISASNSTKTPFTYFSQEDLELPDAVRSADQAINMAQEISNYFEQDSRRYSNGFKDEGGVIGRWR